MGNAKYKLYDSLPEARYYYQRTIALKPEYFEGNFNLGCVLLEKKRAAESIPYFKKASKLDPTNLEYMAADKPDDAIAAFNKKLAATDDPVEQALAYYNIGKTYGQRKGDLETAIKYLAKAIELDSTNAVYYEDLS